MKLIALLIALVSACAHAAGVQVISADATAAAATIGPITQYVNVDGGDDRNDCSAAAPCLTVQAALNKLPKNIYHPVTVQLAPGNYAGAFVEGFTVHAPADAGTDYSYLWVNGTMVSFVPDAGSGSGVISGQTSFSGTTFATLSDSTQSWAPDALKGQFIEAPINSGSVAIPSVYLITSNTATTATVLGSPNALDAGYRLVTTGSIFTSAVTPPSSTGSPAAIAVPAPAGLTFFNNQGYGYAASRLGFALGASNTRGITLTDARVNLFLLRMIASSGVLSGILGQAGMQAGPTVRQSYFSWPSGSGTMLQYTTLGGGSPVAGITLIASMFESGLVALNSSSWNGVLVSNSLFKGQSFAALFMYSNGLNQVANSRFDNVTYAVKTSESAVTGMGFTTFGFSNVDISNCTGAGLLLTGAYASASLDSVSGSGNTVGLIINRGARCAASSSVTLTGAIEVNIDGTPSSWAAMRASTPRVISNPSYFTAFYE